MHRIALILLVAAPLAGCGPLLQAELDGLFICREIGRQDFPASPVPIEGTITHDERVELPSELGGPEGTEVQVELVRMELRAGGIPDVSFAREALVRTQVGATSAAVEIAGARGDDSSTIVFVPDSPLDVTAALGEGSLAVQAELVGELPEQPWSLTASACYRARATYAWTP